jgi:hypothetical protein
LLQSDISAIVEVDYDFRHHNPSINSIIYACSRRLIMRRKIREVCKGKHWFDVHVNSTDRPEHTITDLIAQCDNCEINTGLLEGDQGVLNIATNGFS